jgi:hypothetical protein
MLRIEPIYLAALAVGLAAALALRFLHVAHPWPAAIALNAYGLVAWPGVRQELAVTQSTYAGAWMAATLVLLLLENIARLQH